MNFIEIDGTIINLDKINYVDKILDEYDKTKVDAIAIQFDGGTTLQFDKIYYKKLFDLIKPTIINNDYKK